MNKKFFGAVALGAAALALLSGCAVQDQVSSTTMEQATQPLTCMSKAECDAWWARAQVWVTNHSEYKLQTVTDSIIQTAGPSSGKRALAYQITKTPTNEGTATIGFAAHCDNPLGCQPNPWEAGADFKQFIRNGPGLRKTATPQAGTMPPAAPAPAPAPSGVQVSPLDQPVPLNLESQPGQSAAPLTPQ
ncbi:MULTISPECIES: hypothetical protein [unclassified Caballeronia]|uniref:hypothetical protein n=1 Tax=unclassified Caballeronia TaxID=2646786 RepID=UPI00202942A0|nr:MULTISPECIES: hypothetical protein [unclassified Caballeronia]